MKYIPELDGLRAIAVFMVVFGHSASTLAGGYSGWLAPLFFVSDGNLGVLIFFVLSGFLITSLLINERENTGTVSISAFFVRRTLRIFPAFYTYIGFVALLVATGYAAASLPQILGASLHVWNYIGVLGIGHTPVQGTIILGHFWSLSLEEQFYWLWPAVFLALTLAGSRTLILLLILLVPALRILVYFLCPDQRPYLGMMFHTSIDGIAVGVGAALFRAQLTDILMRAGRRIPIGALLLGYILLLSPLLRSYLAGMWFATYGKTIDAVMIAALILVVGSQPDLRIAALLRSPAFRFFGKISFSLYLWQQMFCLAGSPLALPFPLGIPVAIAFATASYYLIERPFLALKPRRPAAA